MRVSRSFILAILLLLSGLLVAQEEVPDQEAQELPPEEATEQIVLPDEPPAPFQEFDPSEEISEDFSVPFPVDI